ncbi:uncharacterized protein LOC129939882 isoform X2 [Eupeodes corollae]|uniref:uncharacterized protein LOC129939882 isoform X2 n=1 Tax=Eupeodes corollae TaxID=290404 RepID=UPI002490AC22|nr:uncharacterized protein LOC129939882 isoform X2 [Eupeodes corollae]
MEEHIVSEPMDFTYKDGNHMDFTKTFDLTGNDNDQMLKFYLRKAGLSDNIEYLTSEQRRAFIYDIVKSNKNPGYWKPSVLPQTPTPSRGPFHKTPVQRESSMTLDSIDDIPPASATFDLDSYRKIKNKNPSSNEGPTNNPSLLEQNVGSTLYERQFSQNKQPVPKKVVTSSVAKPLPTTVLRTRKGKIIEVSGPKDFRHIAGDMTRDMTKNTFDLSGNFNNNSLKKYMIERGITEEDPPRRQNVGNSIPPPPSETYVAAEPTPPPTPRNIHHSKGGAIIVAPPELPETVAPPSEPVYEEIVPPKRNTTSIRRQRKKPLLPPPPPPPPAPPIPIPRQQSKNRDDALPTSQVTSSPVGQNRTYPPPPPPPPMPIDTIVNVKNIPTPPPPPPPALPSMSIEQTLKTENVPPPPPPMPSLNASVSIPIAPPKPLANNPASKSENQFKPPQTGGGQQRDDFLQSIRAGVALKVTK